MSPLLLLLACSSAPAPEAVPPPAAEEPVAPAPVGPPDAAALQARLDDARTRLQATPAGQAIWRSIEAHGGLAAWHGAGTLAFTFDYQPLAAPERRMYTENNVDLWSSRAWQRELPADLPAGERATLAWDGETAWITPDADAFPTSARFWALTPYYFVAMPFVLADPGVVLEGLGRAELDGVAHELVKASYEDGTGDAPDDHYVLYLHPETGRVGGLRYVVSYPGFFPDGGHSPEKLMVYSAPVQVGPVTLAGRYDTFAWDAEAGERGDLVTRITASDVALGGALDPARFAMPEGAVVSPLHARR